MRDEVNFLMNGARVRLDAVDPTLTVLQWLRQTRRMTGTKEGCGSGDCGACTVVIGRWRQDRIRYDAVNACIAFVPMLEGAHLITVEGLHGDDGALHPVQQALVDSHGSQCGFCTPGFVMSLYALYLSHDTAPGRHEIEDALGGNLCRCTGYGPILDAAARMFDLPRPEQDKQLRADADVALRSLRHDDVVTTAMDGRQIWMPAQLDQFAQLCAQYPKATIVSGATDFALLVTKKNQRATSLIWTGRIDDGGFRDITVAPYEAGSRVTLGGGVTHSDAMTHVPSPQLVELWRRFAGRQVRNTGTIAGNIANGSPIGDLAPALIALDGRLVLRHGSNRRDVPLEKFFVEGRAPDGRPTRSLDRRAGEFIEAVSFELLLPTQCVFNVHKVSKRFDDDISAVCGAFNICVENGRVSAARIGYGGMAIVPKRARHLEAALTGRPWTRATIDAAVPALAADFTPISDMRASADYRLLVAGNLLVRTFVEHDSPETATRLVGASANF